MKKRLLANILTLCLLIMAIPLISNASDTTVTLDINGGKLVVEKHTGMIVSSENLSGELVIPAEVDGIAITGVAQTELGDVSKAIDATRLTSITFPGSMKTIHKNTVQNLGNLRSVIFKDGIERIESFAFVHPEDSRRTNTITFQFPASLTAIGAHFCDSGAMKFEMMLGSENYQLDGQGLLLSADGKLLVAAGTDKLTEVTIPSTVTTIYDSAFERKNTLKKIVVPGSVKEIGVFAFANCANLTELLLSEGVVSIGNNAVSNCDALKSITLPSTVRSFGDGIFSGCDKLKEAVIKHGAPSIGKSMFNACISLESIVLPESVVEIYDYAFGGCTALKQITIEDTTAVVSPHSFEDCPATLTIHGKTGSAAHLYALSYKLNFVSTGKTKILPFNDTEMWAKADILWAVQNGLFFGITQYSFSPNTSMTRAMFATALYRYDGSLTVPGSLPFFDVPRGSYFEKPVIWAASKKIVTGTSPTTFSPNDNITRQDLAVMLYRYAESRGLNTVKSASLSQFIDEEKINAYAKKAVAWAVANNIIKGKTNVTLQPDGNATRAEVAAMLKRFEENLVP